MSFKINDIVLYNNIKAKVTAILSDDRYQIYTDTNKVILVYAKDLILL